MKAVVMTSLLVCPFLFMNIIYIEREHPAGESYIYTRTHTSFCSRSVRRGERRLKTMWESESDCHAGERGLVPVGGGGSSGRYEAALKNDGFVRRDQSWYS
jgi:hypothetical protein